MEVENTSWEHCEAGANLLLQCALASAQEREAEEWILASQAPSERSSSVYDGQKFYDLTLLRATRKRKRLTLHQGQHDLLPWDPKFIQHLDKALALKPGDFYLGFTLLDISPEMSMKPDPDFSFRL